MKILFNGQIVDWPADQPLPAGATIAPEQPVQAVANDFLGYIAQKESEQWYKPGTQFTMTAANIAAGLTVKAREHTSAFGTSMFVDIDMVGKDRQTVKVSGTVASALRDAGKVVNGVVTATINVGSVVITQLNLTDTAKEANSKLPAEKQVKDRMYRASFSWE